MEKDNDVKISGQIFRPWKRMERGSMQEHNRAVSHTDAIALDLSKPMSNPSQYKSSDSGAVKTTLSVLPTAPPPTANSHFIPMHPSLMEPYLRHMQLQSYVYNLQVRLLAMSRLSKAGLTEGARSHSTAVGVDDTPQQPSRYVQPPVQTPATKTASIQPNATPTNVHIAPQGNFPLPSANDGEPLDLLPKSLYLNKSQGGHICIFCGKVYSRKYGLKIHLRTHTGYKPLKCKVCARPFGDPSNLNKHIRLHAEGETPYRCEYCGKVLVRRRDLERHIKSRHPHHSLIAHASQDVTSSEHAQCDDINYIDMSSPLPCKQICIDELDVVS